MRCLPAKERQRLETQLSVLLDASTLLIDRDDVDPTKFSDKKLTRLRDASNALKKAIPLNSPGRSAIEQGNSSPQANAIEATMRQLSRHIGAELRATLAEARRLERDAHGEVTWTTEDRQALLDGGVASSATNPTPPPRAPGSAVLQILDVIERVKDSASIGVTVSRWDHRTRQLAMAQHADLVAALTQLDDWKAQTNTQGALPEKVRQLETFARSLERTLQLQIDVYDDYQSPDSLENICHGRQLEIDAAIRVLQEESETAHADLIARLHRRRDALETLKLEPGDVHVGRLLGEKPITGLGRLLHPINAARQAIRLEKLATKVLSQPAEASRDADRKLLELEHVSEPVLLRTLLAKAGVSDAPRKHQQAHRRVLDSQPWDVIRSDIVVPVATPDGIIARTLQSVATPASHVLTDTNRITHDAGNPVLGISQSPSYLSTDRHGNIVRGGFNSHDTEEASHALMATHDELQMDGQVLFGGTRHAVHAPFGLPGHLAALPAEQAATLIRQLVGPANRRPTIENIRYPGVAAPAKGAPVSDSQADNPVGRAFETRLQVLLAREKNFVEALNNAEFIDASASAQAPPTVSQLLDEGIDAGRLTTMVLQDAELMHLLVRQGALNRAREAIVMEIARDPRLGQKIADGEPLLFTSISLLTPDELRHFAAMLSGGKESLDEKSMLEIQVQAYRDLQQEINAGGLVINGKTFSANILPFNWGVNAMSLLKPGNDPVIGAMINGHDFSNELCNRESLEKLVGLPGEGANDAAEAEAGSEVDRFLRKSHMQLQTTESAGEVRQLNASIAMVEELQKQIRQIWSEGSYRSPGNEPYKMPARIALLSHLLAGGTLFNCKSGKDRTGQLSVETKFLALRAAENGGKVPAPDAQCTPVELAQYAALTFLDKTRTRLQQLATGYAGSKLSGAAQILSNLFRAAEHLRGEKGKALSRERLREFLGLSGRTKS